jgi:hypothetical protein
MICRLHARGTGGARRVNVTGAMLDTEARTFMSNDRTMMALLDRHWQASDAGDFIAEHEIYREDALLIYPQSGEQIRGRHNIRESRQLQPNRKRFSVRRITGRGDLWVSEITLTYDDQPSYVVSIMEFSDDMVARETQYFSDRFDPGPSRAHLVEPMTAIAMRR